MSTAHLLADLNAELRANMAAAVYVVVDVLDVDCLVAIEHHAILAGQPGRGLGLIIGVQATDVVLVGDVDACAWNSMLAEMAPYVSVRVLPGVRSAALALGHRFDSVYDVAAIDAKRATWAVLVADARLADLQADLERLDLPGCAPAGTVKLRRARQ